MKRKALFLVTIIMAVSLSACTNHTASTVDSTGAEVEASSVSTAEKAESSGAVESDRTAESPISSFELVKEPSAAESAASESPVPTSSEAPRERIAEVSQASAAESPSAESTKPAQAQTEPTQPANPSVSSEPEPPVSSQPEPTSSEPPSVPEPKPTAPVFDVSRYVSFAKDYGTGIGLKLDSTAVSCWDDPITANASCTYLERDIRDRLDWYLSSSFISSFHSRFLFWPISDFGMAAAPGTKN